MIPARVTQAQYVQWAVSALFRESPAIDRESANQGEIV
jgi:hypothetical protein